MISRNVISDCESLIRSGQTQQAAHLISKINVAQIPRKMRLPLANLCRRTGLVGTGLRIMTPVVRPVAGGRRMDATFAEMAEYAVLLQRSGSVREALQILSSIPEGTLPEASLFFAYCYFNIWEYEKSVPHLERYLAAAPSVYMSLVARVNLSAALIYAGNWERAKAELLEVDSLARKTNSLRLRANGMELLAQIQIRENDFTLAEKTLTAANQLLAAANTHDQLFVLKWMAVVNALRSGSTGPLLELRRLALARGESEAVREADIYRIKIAFDENIFDHVYFGTPFTPYRERISNLLNRVPARASYTFGETGGNFLDLGSGSLAAGEPLDANGKILGVFRSLLKDLYRPQQIGGLFADLFPGEHFDIFSSPGRVRQLIYRARQWADGNRLPIEIHFTQGRYSVSPRGAFGFRIPLQVPAGDAQGGAIESLKNAFRSKDDFTAREAEELLGVSRATCLRILRQGLEAGTLSKFGAGNGTIYYFNSGEAA